MYRDSLLGLALAATLDELSETHNLSEGHKEQLWGVFDRCMDACLAEVPRQTHITIRVPPPSPVAAATAAHLSSSSSVTSHASTAVTTAATSPPPLHLTLDDDDDTTAEQQHERQERDDDGHDAVVRDAADATFPLYRCADGVWTLLLRNPVVVVRDELGVEEQLCLDYLKVYLKDTTRGSGSHSGRGGGGGGKTTRRGRSSAAAMIAARSNNSSSSGAAAVMYSDGNRKTLSELQREAEATRARIAEEARQLERITDAMAKTQFTMDQLFRFFAHGVRSEAQKNMLVDVLDANYPDVHMENLPLLPVATAMANGRLTNVRRIYAADNTLVDDAAFVFFVHVLRFAPQAAQVDYLDISGTHVRARGLFFALEMVAERTHPFTLVAKRLRLRAADKGSRVNNRAAADGNDNDNDGCDVVDDEHDGDGVLDSQRVYCNRCHAMLTTSAMRKHTVILDDTL